MTQDCAARAKCCGNTKEWRRQLGNTRTRCEPPILSYLRMKVCLFNIGTIITIAHACVCVCVNFGDEILLRGEEFKTREN